MSIVQKLTEGHLDEAKQDLFGRLNSAAISSIKTINEVSFDRQRSEFAAHASMARGPVQMNPAKKYRLKDSKTGATRGIFDTKDAAVAAHQAHPEAKKLVVEEFDPATDPCVILEYYAKGSVNGKPFRIATDDDYSKKQIASQNPHLEDAEVAALHAHTQSDDFTDGDESVTTFHDGMRVSTHSQGGYHGDLSDTQDKIKKMTESTLIPKSQIPAYVRKKRGEVELSLKDLENEKNASPTTKEGLKKRQEETGVTKD